METFCEKKIREKLTGEKLQGGCNNPPLLYKVYNWFDFICRYLMLMNEMVSISF